MRMYVITTETGIPNMPVTRKRKPAKTKRKPKASKKKYKQKQKNTKKQTMPHLKIDIDRVYQFSVLESNNKGHISSHALENTPLGLQQMRP